MKNVCEQQTPPPPHVVLIPCPAQGHVMPVMKLAYCLAERGFKITFVNTEFIHARLINSLVEKEKGLGINLVSISDGLTPEERQDADKLMAASRSILPIEFEKLIRDVNESGIDGKIACVIADETMDWALEVAEKLGIRHASFFPGAAALKSFVLQIPKLIERGVIDENGTPKTKEIISWCSSLPGIKPSQLMWHNMAGFMSSEAVFKSMLENIHISKSADWILCNTFEELEHSAISMVPNLLPIGPLLANNEIGSLWPEDLTCLSWLDQQAASSVIYLAFGSIAIHSQHQFEELALGLELLGRPFLWVFRSGSDLYGRPSTTFPEGFQDRVAHIGKIVGWAPQSKVLSHPSIACFVSHCGWNSTIEGVSMGVPFISWPYFADQLYDETYITTVWRVGLGLNPDEDGIISRDEIKDKLNQLLGDQKIKENSLRLKEMAMNSVKEGGSSFNNLELFVEELRQEGRKMENLNST